jgi:putative ABC transport system permease protein
MFLNYVLVALRNLRKHRLYSFITIGGLAVGLAACLMILLFVRDEVSYDEWLPNAERIANIEVTFHVPGREPMELGSSPGPLAPALMKDFSSDIERAVRIWESGELVRHGDKQFEETIAYADPGFFEVFDLPVVAGEREAALAGNTALLMTETMAAKYFGDEPAVGKVVTVDQKTDYTVVGVLKDLPRNTHLQLDFIALFDTERYKERPWVAENWTSANTHTYVLFRDRAAIDRVVADLPAFVDRNVKLEIPALDRMRMSELLVFNAMPLLDIHLHARKNGYFKDGGDITTVITFSAIAALILLIACINFVNLATARSMSRAREVAMRKVVGARRSQLVGQFLGEAVLTAAVAMIIAVALVEVALGPYGSFIDKPLSLDVFGDPSLLLLMVGLVAVVGVLGGLYPAIYLSRFRPARVLKANQSSASGSTFTRNALVVFQFAVSIGLIVSTAVVYGQTRYARDLDVGYERDHKLVIRAISDMPDADKAAQTLKAEIAALPGVERAALSSDAPPLRSNNNTLLYPKPTLDAEKYIFEKVRVDHDFFAVYGVEPIAGRVFSGDRLGDIRNVPDDEGAEPTQAIVINEMAVTKLGLTRAEDAVGVVLWDTLGPGDDQRLIRTEIIGVVPDLHLRSVHFHLTPMLYTLHATGSGEFYALTADVKPGEAPAAMAAIEGIWSRMAPGVPLRTQWIDEAVAAQYDAIEKRGHMFGVFSIFAVLIACLGLFGLASFAAERRTKEIGVRKALGAGVVDIVRLLMWQFSKPVLLANAIAWPAAFYVMSRWLETFRFHIELTDPLLLIGVFGGAGLLAMAIAWATVAGQAARVARASPIHALRCE